MGLESAVPSVLFLWDDAVQTKGTGTWIPPCRACTGISLPHSAKPTHQNWHHITGDCREVCAAIGLWIPVQELSVSQDSAVAQAFWGTLGSDLFLCRCAEQDMHSRMRKRNVTKAARPTQKAMTMESVGTAGDSVILHGRNKTQQDDLPSLLQGTCGLCSTNAPSWGHCAAGAGGLGKSGCPPWIHSR